MLFLEMGASTSAPAQNAQSPTNESPKKQQEVEMEQDDDSDASVMFRDRVVRAARDYMEDSGYSNTSLQTWNSNNSSGAELEFERRTRNHTSNIFILITALQRPSPSAIVNVGRIVDLSRNLLSSFTVQPASVKDNIINGVAVALSGSG
ncbi:hypothetical protein OESDEN_19222 [Oesophagostomum dentatum]|uniref:Uncharacterized protein n=1 Tax=Oesophagostomum dentatum TaxID=61180 RepID=A0A0B1S6Y2_OESDE|nr:hypothetical protein OESDEN_19222 [Oesophagostomum dentatum]